MSHVSQTRRNPIGFVGASSNVAVSGSRRQKLSRLPRAPSLGGLPTASRLFGRAAFSDRSNKSMTADDRGSLVRRSLFNDGDIQAYLFSPRSPKNGNLGALGAIGVLRRTHAVEVNIMRKILTTLVAATAIAATAVATSGPAEAQWHGGWRGGWGWGPGPFIGGLAAGALIGGALAAPYAYPYPYGYYAGAYAPPPYGGPCVWRRVWNGYGWVRACV